MAEKKTFDLSLTQIAAGSLAAVTAAALGSRLGLAGTVLGAALASIVTTVASAVYAHSLAGSVARVHTWRPGSGSDPTDPATDPVTDPVTDPPGPADDTAAAIEHAEHVERVSHDAVHVQQATGRPSDQGSDQGSGHATDRPSAARRRFAAAAGALVVFVVALFAVTGIEALRGGPLSGSGDGTTVTRVWQQATSGGGDPAPAEDQRPAPTTAAEPAPTTPPPTGSAPSGTPSETSSGTSSQPTATTTPQPAPTTAAPTSDGDPPRATTSVAPSAQPGS